MKFAPFKNKNINKRQYIKYKWVGMNTSQWKNIYLIIVHLMKCLKRASLLGEQAVVHVPF